MNHITVELADETLRTEWEAFLADHCPDAWTHCWQWRYIYQAAYGLEAKYYVACRNDRITGILPTIVLNSITEGRGLFSLPYLDYAGLIGDEESQRGILHHLNARGERLVVREAAREPVEKPDYGAIVTMRQDIGQGAGALWEGFSAKVRNQIRKFDQAGIEIVTGPEHVDSFFGVWRRRMHQLGTPAHCRRWFSHIFATIPHARCYVALKSSKPVGGLVWLRQGSMAAVPWAAVDRQEQRHCVNHGLYWRAIQDAVFAGATTFDFLRSTVGSGTYNYKKQWGAKPYALQYVTFHGGHLTKSGWFENSAVHRALAGLWSYFPSMVTKRLDGFLRKRVP